MHAYIHTRIKSQKAEEGKAVLQQRSPFSTRHGCTHCWEQGKTETCSSQVLVQLHAGTASLQEQAEKNPTALTAELDQNGF